MALVGIAGPITNFVLAILFGAIRGARDLHGHDASRSSSTRFYVNIVLGVFNLLPIPPLDGSRIVAGFMDRTHVRRVVVARPVRDGDPARPLLRVPGPVHDAPAARHERRRDGDLGHRRRAADRRVSARGSSRSTATTRCGRSSRRSRARCAGRAARSPRHFPDRPVTVEELVEDRGRCTSRCRPGSDLRAYRVAAFQRRIDLLGGGPDGLADELCDDFLHLRSSLIEPYADTVPALDRLDVAGRRRAHHERERRRREDAARRVASRSACTPSSTDPRSPTSRCSWSRWRAPACPRGRPCTSATRSSATSRGAGGRLQGRLAEPPRCRERLGPAAGRRDLVARSSSTRCSTRSYPGAHDDPRPGGGARERRGDARGDRRGGAPRRAPGRDGRAAGRDEVRGRRGHAAARRGRHRARGREPHRRARRQAGAARATCSPGTSSARCRAARRATWSAGSGSCTRSRA